MRKSFIAVLAFVLFAGPLFSQDNGTSIQEYRDSIDDVFGDSEHSILLHEDLESFEGLHYFDFDESFQVTAKFKRIKNGEEFQMKTSTTRLPVYKPYGILKFKVNGKKEKLTVYQNVALSKKEEYSDYLFIPFTDLTNNDETYGGGRYLDISAGDLENPVIDFNKCYNPYCAYNHKYSCPIPPLENHLKVRIEAGVKKWHD